MARILSIGSALQDVYLIDHDDLVATTIGTTAILGKVLVGSKVDIDQIKYCVGGGGVNSAITFARYGHTAGILGNVAKDMAGAIIPTVLEREGVVIDGIKYLERGNTGVSIILLDKKSGERTILTCRGASEKFDNFGEGDIAEFQPDWLYATTLRGDMATLEKILKYTRENGIKVMFNPGVKELDCREELMQLLRYVDVLIVNKSEAMQLVDGVELTELLRHLNELVEIAIITDGSMGGVAGNRMESYRFGLYENSKVKDATGAGDAFGSGFLASYVAGKSFRSALIFAAANATAVVGKLGANAGILTSTEDLHSMPIQKL